MITEYFLFVVFVVIMIGFMIVDLGFLNRKAHEITMKSAVIQSIFWVSISLLFGSLVWFGLGDVKGAEWMSAYITEKMLSVDNLFVILMIFTYFKLSRTLHHKVLFWGILGAVILRGVFIGGGSILVQHFHWILYFFGAFLVYTGAKLLVDKEEEEEKDFKDSKVAKFLVQHLPFIEGESEHFIIRGGNGYENKIFFTLLFLILVLVEITDIIFATDSIPAVFSITQDPFIAFTSNMFAVMGLRSLFFLLENILTKFEHLKKGISLVLVFIGAKMLAEIFHVSISPVLSFAIILFTLGASLVVSLIFSKKNA